jgi:hypothetical protein
VPGLTFSLSFSPRQVYLATWELKELIFGQIIAQHANFSLLQINEAVINTE